jgi:IPT/TIG domain-containing protein
MPAPILTNLSPSTAVLGGPAFTLTINGSGFTSDAAALWGGLPLTTTYLSASQVTAAVPKNLLAESAATLLTVSQGAPALSGNTLTFLVPNPIDLATLADVRPYAGSTDPSKNGDDPLLQDLITGASQYWLTRTGRGCLNSIVQYTERYDGNGKDALMLRYYPIVAVETLSLDALSIPVSPDYLQSGYIIDPATDSLVLIGGCSFGWGRLSVAVTYMAGYPEVPYDIADAVRKQVAINFKRRSTLDQGMVNYPQTGGSTSYRSWEVPPEVERVIQNYKRTVPN